MSASFGMNTAFIIETHMNIPTQCQKGMDCHSTGKNLKYLLPISNWVQHIQNGIASEIEKIADINQPMTGIAFNINYTFQIVYMKKRNAFVTEDVPPIVGRGLLYGSSSLSAESALVSSTLPSSSAAVTGHSIGLSSSKSIRFS